MMLYAFCSYQDTSYHDQRKHQRKSTRITCFSYFANSAFAAKTPLNETIYIYVKHWKTWYAYFKYTTRMGYVPPPRRLRYRTNLYVIVGLVQRIDDVLLRHSCILEFVSSQSWDPKNIIAYNHFYGIMWTILSKLFSCITRRTKLWCGLDTLQTPFSTWTRLDVSDLLFGTSEFCHRWASRTFEDWRVEQLLRDRFWKDVVCSTPERRWLSFEPW